MTNEPTSREDRWLHLADMVAMVVALFGAPAVIAATRILRRQVRIDLLFWLAPLEALARRLLLLEAAALAPRNAAPPRIAFGGRIVNALLDAPPPTLSEDPAQWRAQFTLWPRGARRRERPTREARPHQTRVISENALPLARRLEALFRLLQDRRTYVARMARLLAARRESARTAFTPYRFGGPLRTLLEETQAQVDAALANTS